MTRRGVVLAATGGLFIAAGWWFNWAAFLAVGLALAFLVLLALGNYVRSSEVSISRQILPSRVERGGLAISYLHVRNVGKGRFWGAEAFQVLGDNRLVTSLPRLRRGEEGTRTVQLPTSRRGVFTVGPVVVTRRDPLDLVEVNKSHGDEVAFLVSPRILPLKPVVNALTQSLDGKTDDMSPHGSMTFHQLREYVPGDDIRKIHWKATARQASTGTLIVRQDVDNAQPVTTVLVDVRPSGYSPESFEMAIDMAASIVHAANLGRSPFRLRLTNSQGIAGDSMRAVDRALEMLTEVHPQPVGSVHSELAHLGQEKGGAVLVVVTGVAENVDVQLVANMRFRYRRTFLVSVTPEPRPIAHYPGITVIQGSNLADLVDAWNIGVKA